MPVLTQHQAITLLEQALDALGPLAAQMVFVGGAVIPLVIEATFQGDARATTDVDCVVGARTHGQFHEIEVALGTLGFTPGQEPGDPICRHRCGTLILDVMPVRELGFGHNRWYDAGVATCQTMRLPSGRRVQVFRTAYLFASKVEAFHGRGSTDPFASDDMADLVLLMEGCPDLLEDIATVEDDALKDAVAEWAEAMLVRPDLSDLLDGHLARTATRGRAWVLRRLQTLARLRGRGRQSPATR